MTVVARTADVEMRLARLACMPSEVDAALGCFKAQVRSVWCGLGAGRETSLLGSAMVRATPPLPPLRPAAHASLDALLAELDRALWNHHPEEIRVASFTFLTNLADVVRSELGEPRLLSLLAALERLPS